MTVLTCPLVKRASTVPATTSSRAKSSLYINPPPPASQPVNNAVSLMLHTPIIHPSGLGVRHKSATDPPEC